MLTGEKLSKALCFILRHKPEAISIKLDSIGQAKIADLIEGFAKQGTKVTLEGVVEMTRSDDKQRFSLSEDGFFIRAVQGHSFPIAVDAFIQETPPAVLYHGTAEGNLESIFKEGLNPQSRQHVHLSDHVETARVVGIRYRKKGEVKILTLDTQPMIDAGVVFYKSMNGVWLVDHVPPHFLKLM